MLYIFHVDTGTMMTFDMNLAMEKVINLQGVIARGCRISEDKQVLLISGGESLDPNAVVGKYHAGTDTNPIFLFSKSTIESAIPPSPSVNYGSDIDLQGQVEGSLLMPPAYETVVSRAQLALQFQDVDTEELKACERLIHDQHLQQQGWAAVVANLEDVTSELQNRSETFHETYKQYLEDRQSYRDLITSVTESLQLLSKIPVIPSLVRSCDVTPVDCSSSTEDLAKFSLFDWISSQDTNHTLHDMVEQCGKATEQLDEKVDESLKGEVDQMMKEVQNDGMKEVKGLEDRLYGLDQIISGARKIVQEQAELAQGFVQNQNRLSNIRDRSILPDLCSSHRNQLIEMMKNHSRLREIKKKCRMAKEELSVNLHTRLRWVMYVEKKICDVDGKLTIYLGNLRRLRKRLDILQQVQDSPKVYAQLMIEVVRRKQFSSKFLSWANSLAEDSSRLHAEELKRRDSFLRIIGHHFLQAMFHGFEDFPPAFATEAPEEFDGNLPDITADDIKQLKEAVPELSGVLSVPVEEDLFVALTNVQDPMVQWVDSSEPNSKVLTVPRKLSRARSDSDAVHEEHMQPYSIEGGSISLGDQFEECKVEEEDLVCKPRFDSLSPPDKEFLLPKSLSEELTLEMKKQEAALKKELCDTTDDSKRKEGNSNSTSTTPIPSLPTVKHRVSRKSLTDTSPDMETSQEFTTADFYFDESMPSSIESPPKSSTEMKVNQEQIILAEKQLNAKLQLQLKESNKKLSQNEKTLKALCEFVENKIPSLRDNVKDLKKEQKDHIQNVLVDMEDLRTNVIQMVQTYDKVVTENNQAMLDKLTAEKDKRSNELSELLELETKKAKDLQKSLERLEEEMKEKELKVSELKEQESQFETKLEEVRNGLLSEIKELTQKYELEVEVEVDKARSESSVSISNLEKELADKTNIICEKESAIKTLEKEKIKLEENLMDKFQVEKEQICDILEIEYEQKLANAEKEHNEKVGMMKQSIVAELKEKHETETKQKLDDLKQSLMVEKEQAVEMTQSLMVTEHSKAADEIKQKLIDEKSAEMAKYSEEMESKYQDDVAKLSAEFNKEKELLFNELSAIKNREYSHIESQTVNSVFNVSDNDAQTSSAPAQLDSQAQTNVTEQLTASMQTDPSDQTHLAIQTDTTDTKSSTMQTDKAEVNEHSGQTDVTQLYDMSVQTEICDTGCEKTTCDTPDKMASVSDDKSETPSNGNAEEKVGSDNHNVTIEEMKAEHDQKLAKMEEDHNAEISKLIALIEKEKEDAQQLKSSLTSMTGDKQTKFNEAVNRVSKEKDRVIEELKMKESKVVEDIKKLKEQIETLKEEKSKAEDIKERALTFLKDKEANQRLLESELGLAQQQVIQYKEQLQNLAPDSSDITVTKSSSSVVKISDPEEPALHQRIKDLEDVVRLKDEELSKMQQKVMELSMSASTRSLVQDKVSITSCHVGDLVLLCLDERLDQYVVFTVGTTLHFLHTDCLTPLGLKSEGGECKKQWLIAEVIDKEYCQAKKSNNRFKVPVGTKFYRVKAKRWTREGNQSPVKKSDTASGSS